MNRADGHVSRWRKQLDWLYAGGLTVTHGGGHDVTRAWGKPFSSTAESGLKATRCGFVPGWLDDGDAPARWREGSGPFRSIAG